MPPTGKRKAPMSVSAGILSSEPAGQQGGARSTAKRTRFEAQGSADDDVEGDLDIEEQDRKRNQQGRKGRVVTDGYDSEEEDEVVGLESESDDAGEDEDDEIENINGKHAGADEDDDMFNLNDDEEGVKSTLKKKEGKGFLKEKDIEGQELSEYESDGEGDAEFELESEPDEAGDQSASGLTDPDAIVRPLKKRAKTLRRKVKDGAAREDSPDMGFQMERFNMKNEMATGRFDEEGNYIANAKDPHAEHDKWLSGQYNRKTISAARTAQQQRERAAREREAKREGAKLDEDECKMRLTQLMRRSESVLEALQRLGAGVRRQGKKDGQEESVAALSAKSDLDQLTSISSELMSRFGRVNIYDVTYEELLRDVRRSGLVRQNFDPASDHDTGGKGKGDTVATGTFVYKWSPAYLAATTGEGRSEEQEQFGPFDTEELKAWRAAGYFGDDGERIVLRSSDATDHQPWKAWQEVFH